MSYAHTPVDESTGGGDPNRWVHRLFDSLCTELLQITSLRKGAQAGFLSRHPRAGDEWPDDVARALATCRLFVPLYSPRYFDNEQCGREWSAIQRRLRAHAPEPPPVIIPIVWSPVDFNDLPACARAIPFYEDGLWPGYRSTGLYGVIKISFSRRTFQRATSELARRIKQVAELSPLLEAQDLPRYSKLPNAFAGYRAAQKMTVTVVAPHLGNLPEGRNPYYYGRTPHEWNPYRHETDQRSLAHQVTAFVRVRGYGAEVGPLTPLEDGRRGPDAPEMMLVDPWATDIPDTYETLRRFGRRSTRWFPVVVPWNNDDGETTAAEPRLRRKLGEAIPGEQGEPAVHNVRSLEDLRRDMPKMLARVFNRYLRTARVYPPPGPSAKRPRLMEPGNDDDERRQ
nr:TIR-like protein FxsC [Nonomuraea turkmeniaca]